MLFLFPLLFLFQEPVIPFRDRADYVVELKYELKQKPQDNTVAYEAERGVVQRTSSGQLPFLVVHVTILDRKEEEVKFRCETNLKNTLFNRKSDKGQVFKIEMGFIDDMKDRVTAYSYHLMAMSEDKDPLNQIEMTVLEDGTFLVNGEKRGKF
jgi:hypothetical protein